MWNRLGIPSRSRCAPTMSRMILRIVVAAAVLGSSLFALPQAASAATGCSKSWHYITHGETGRNVRPEIGADGSRPVFVDASNLMG
jgi:hypothetical protein